MTRPAAARAEHPVHRIGLRFAGADPRVALRENADLDDDELARITTDLHRLDRARDAPWRRATVTLIERRPETNAAELAQQTDRELLPFKRDVRKLKELGLTESPERGHRLSPRRRAVLGHTSA